MLDRRCVADLANHLLQERKFFDSADHAMGAAGVKAGTALDATPVETGSVIATADNIKKDKPARPPSMVSV